MFGKGKNIKFEKSLQWMLFIFLRYEVTLNEDNTQNQHSQNLILKMFTIWTLGAPNDFGCQHNFHLLKFECNSILGGENLAIHLVSFLHIRIFLRFIQLLHVYAKYMSLTLGSMLRTFSWDQVPHSQSCALSGRLCPWTNVRFLLALGEGMIACLGAWPDGPTGGVPE